MGLDDLGRGVELGCGRRQDRFPLSSNEAGVQDESCSGVEDFVFGDGDDVVDLGLDVLPRQVSDSGDAESVGDGASGVGWVPDAVFSGMEGVGGICGEFGFYPDDLGVGTSAVMAAAIPEMRPPPEIGTRMTSISGASVAISSPMVPWPLITFRSLKGGMIALPVWWASSIVRGVALLGGYLFDSGAQRSGGFDFPQGCVVGENDVGGDAEGSGCVGDGLGVVAGGVCQHAAGADVGSRRATAVIAPRIL